MAKEKGSKKCSDLIDNDFDGLTDGDDLDCSGDPANPPFVATHEGGVGMTSSVSPVAIPYAPVATSSTSARSSGVSFWSAQAAEMAM